MAAVLGLLTLVLAGVARAEPRSSWRVGNEWATWDEFQLVSSDRIVLDGEDITDELGPIMEVNGRALVWGRGFINILNRHAREQRATFPWATNAFAEWSDEGFATYTYANMVTDWDNAAGIVVPSIIRFYPGTRRGCGSYDAYMQNWRASLSQEVAGPVRQNDKLVLDTPSCMFFASEKVYVSARALAEAFKLRMTYDFSAGEIRMFTKQRPEPQLDEIDRVSISYSNSEGYYVGKPAGGFRAYPGTLLWAVVAADSTNKMVMRKENSGFGFERNDAYRSIDVVDRWGNVEGRIWPTHFVAYFDEVETNNLVTRLEKDNYITAAAGGFVSILLPETKILKMLGTGLSGAYGYSAYSQIVDIKNCMANAKIQSRTEIGVIFVNPATFPLANRFLNNGIAGCVDHAGYVSPVLAYRG